MSGKSTQFNSTNRTGNRDFVTRNFTNGGSHFNSAQHGHTANFTPGKNGGGQGGNGNWNGGQGSHGNGNHGKGGNGNGSGNWNNGNWNNSNWSHGHGNQGSWNNGNWNHGQHGNWNNNWWGNNNGWYGYGRRNYWSFYYPSFGWGFGYPLLGWGLGYTGLGLGYGGWGGYGYGSPYYGSYGTSYGYPSTTTYLYADTTDAYAPATTAQPTAPATNQVAAAGDYAGLGEDAFRAGRYDEALRNWQHAMVDDPNNGAVVLLMAQAMFALGQFDAAANSVQMAMQILPEAEWGNVVKNYTQLYGNVEDYTNQVRAAEKARDAKPDDGAIRFVLGYHFGFLNYPKQAVRELDKALDIESRDVGSQKLRDLFAKQAGIPARAPAAAPGANLPPALGNPAPATPAPPVAQPPQPAATPPAVGTDA